MPTKQRIGLRDEQCTLPCLEPTGEKHQQSSITVSELRSVDLTTQDNELLSKKGILQDQLLFTPAQVHEGVSRKAKVIANWLAPQPADDASECWDYKHEEELKKRSQNTIRLLGNNAELRTTHQFYSLNSNSASEVLGVNASS